MNQSLSGLRVDVLVPQPLEGSGGHRTIYTNAAALSAAGAKVRVHCEDGGHRSLRRLKSLFGAQGLTLKAGWPSRLSQSDLLLATTWQSALAAPAVETSAIKAHFVQDYECWFNPRGYEFLMASRAHDLGLASITIGEWLPQQLWREHRLPARIIPFTADLGCYFPEPASSANGGARRVVAMYQPEKPRRCPVLMEEALSRVLVAEPSVEVVTVGSHWNPDLGKRHRHVGIVEPNELATLYRESTVGFSLSSSNPSRVPFEMMASGLPVVELGGDNTIFDFPEEGCLLAEPDPASCSAAILKILGDSELAARMSRDGAEFMASRSAPEEQAAFVRAVASIAAGEPTGEPTGSPRYSAEILSANGTGSAILMGRRSLRKRIKRRLIQLRS